MIAAWILGSRKFLLMAILVIVASIFRVCHVIESKDYADLLSSVGVAFMGANTVEHMFAAAKEWAISKQGVKNDDKDTE